QELDLQTALAQSLATTRGLGVPEAASVLLRAEELATSLGDRSALLTVWLGLMTHYSLQLKLHASRDIGQQACALAESIAGEALVGHVHGELGLVLRFLGDLGGARIHFERAFMGRDLSERDFVGSFNENKPYPVFVPLALWALGYSDQARRWSMRGLAA